jgi:hypothetical protein
MWFPRSPNGAEVYVLLVFGAFVFFVLGAFGIICGLIALADRQQLAHAAIRYGLFCILLSATLIIGLVVGKRRTGG